VGLFTGLLTLPLAPVRGVAWVAEQLMEEAERQYYDEGAIRAELLELELEAERGDLSPEDIRAREDALLQRLAESQARRRVSPDRGYTTDVEGQHPNG
jgi:hypothetical protein